MKRLSPLLFSALFLLSACQAEPAPNPLNLSAEQQQGLAQQIERLEAELEAQPKGEDPDHAKVLGLARAYEDLGQAKKALKIYQDYLEDGHVSAAMLNNAGRLHEKLGQHEEAIAYYQRLVEDYADLNYLYDIAWARLRMEDLAGAQGAYNQWRLALNKSDLQTEQALQALRQK